MRKILDSHRLMFQDFARFTDTVKAAQTVFTRWDDLMKEFVNTAREVTRKRAEKFIPIKVTAHHKALAERLVYIYNFR
jgi:dynein heavy chain 1